MLLTNLGPLMRLVSLTVQESYSITSGVLDADPFAGGAYPVHLAAAVELRRTSDLFLLGHRCSFRLRTDERVHTLQGRLWSATEQLSGCWRGSDVPGFYLLTSRGHASPHALKC